MRHWNLELKKARNEEGKVKERGRGEVSCSRQLRFPNLFDRHVAEIPEVAAPGRLGLDPKADSRELKISAFAVLRLWTYHAWRW